MTLQLTALDERSEISWVSPAAGLWVASRRAAASSDYAGMVERLDGLYHARSARGRALGSFEDLDSARAAIDGGPDETGGAPRGVEAALWLVIGAAAASSFALALALLR